MADDVLLEFLHVELVSRVLEIKDKQQRDAAISKLEYIGFSAGYRLIERLTKDWYRFTDELDTMKFICKEFWMAIFMRQVDNLRTNNQGVYVLQDNNFRFMAKISSGKEYLDSSAVFLAYTCGLIRGALTNLGLQCIVTPEVTNMPACKFHIQIQRT